MSPSGTKLTIQDVRFLVRYQIKSGQRMLTGGLFQSVPELTA
jgi:hypothetical protein